MTLALTKFQEGIAVKIPSVLLTLAGFFLFIGCAHAAEQRNPPDGVWAVDLEATSKNVPEKGVHPSMQTICGDFAVTFVPLMRVLEVEGATAWHSILGMPTVHKRAYQLVERIESQGDTLVYKGETEDGHVSYLNLTHIEAGKLRVRWGSPPKLIEAAYVWQQQTPQWLANEKMDLSAAVDRRYAVFSKLCPHDTK